jgi:hypothetical protein
MSAIEGNPDIHRRCAEGPRLTQIRHRRSCLAEPGRTGAAPARWCEASTARASTTKAFLAPAALSIGWCLEEASAPTTYRHAVVDADQ